MPRKTLLAVALLVAAAAGAFTLAAQKRVPSLEHARGIAADLVAPRDAVDAGPRVPPARTLRAPLTPRAAPPLYPVTEEEVYDVDSFGRNVRWLGLTSAFVTLTTGCPKPTTPDEYCQELNATPGAFTSFDFQDAARIKLPKYATNSLLCYWFSPVLSVRYSNPTAARVVGRFNYSPTLTLESDVLNDPALIDPTTGVPFGGKLQTGMSSSELFEVPLEAGVAFSERTRDSTVCMAGLISRKALIANYGLSEAQADDFFAGPITVRLNVRGSVRYVSDANLVFGLRLVGD